MMRHAFSYFLTVESDSPTFSASVPIDITGSDKSRFGSMLFSPALPIDAAKIDNLLFVSNLQTDLTSSRKPCIFRYKIFVLTGQEFICRGDVVSEGLIVTTCYVCRVITDPDEC